MILNLHLSIQIKSTMKYVATSIKEYTECIVVIAKLYEINNLCTHYNKGGTSLHKTSIKAF